MFIKIKNYDIARDIKRSASGRSTIFPHLRETVIINTNNIKYINKINSDQMYNYEWSDVNGGELYKIYLGGGNGTLGFFQIDKEDADRIFEIIGVSL